MLWFTISEALPFLDKKIKQAGTIRSADERSTNLTQEEYNDFEQTIKDKAFFTMTVWLSISKIMLRSLLTEWLQAQK